MLLLLVFRPSSLVVLQVFSIDVDHSSNKKEEKFQYIEEGKDSYSLIFFFKFFRRCTTEFRIFRVEGISKI